VGLILIRLILGKNIKRLSGWDLDGACFGSALLISVGVSNAETAVSAARELICNICHVELTLCPGREAEDSSKILIITYKDT